MVLRHYLLGVISALLPPLIFTASDVCILIPWKRNSKLQETNHITLVGMLFFKRKFLKNYSIVALHCCVMFWCTIKWISYMYTYNLSCLDFLSIQLSGQRALSSFLCCIVGSRQLSGIVYVGFPVSSVGKESACSAGDLGLIPGSGRSPGEGNGKPCQYSCLENHDASLQ